MHRLKDEHKSSSFKACLTLLFIVSKMAPQTRLAKARPSRDERLENAALRNRVKKGYEKAQQQEAFKELLITIGANGGKLPYGAMDKLVKKYQGNGFKAVTRQNLYYRLKNRKEDTAVHSLEGKTVSIAGEATAIVSELTDTSNSTVSCDSINISSSRSNVGGRKKGSTKQQKAADDKKKDEVIAQCAFLYHQEREKAKKNRTNVPDGTLKRLVLEEEEKAGLSINSVSLDTIRSRVKRGNLIAYNPAETPPIAEIEPMLCDICIRLGKMGQPLTKATVIELANSLISKTEFQEKLEAAKKLRHLDDEGKLGAAWYRGFLSRHQSLLTTRGTVIKDVKRRTWVTRENFENMYENIYETMVEAGVAEELTKPIQYDEGLPTKYRLIHPEYVLFVDETGCNTNQLNDGRVGGELFILPKLDSECGAPTGATTDLHYTVLPFVSGTGEAVLCAIIFKSELDISEIPINWKTGIDITCEDVEDRAKVMCGGPTCFYQGKTIPCFYGTSPKASITTELLTEMLKYLDRLQVYDRTKCEPFLLLDGHGSRMMLPFLDYINHPEHKWHVCFGVPYATHLWQVGDASSLNGVFKAELTRAKRNYIKHRSIPKFEPTDIVPLTNIAFSKSFAKAENVKKAVEKRGWNPLNYNLLTVIPFPDAIDLTRDETIHDKENQPPPSKKLNVNQGIGSYYVDLLIESAQLASHNHYTLDEAVRDMVFERHAAQEAAQVAIEQRKRAAELKKNEALNSALQKFHYCPNGLTVPEMKAIVTATTKASDSPVKKKKGELQQQLFREPRYSRAKALGDDLRRTFDSAAAEALISMVGPVESAEEAAPAVAAANLTEV